MSDRLPLVRIRTITGTEASVKVDSLDFLVEAVAAEMGVDPDDITLTARGVDLDTSPDAFTDLVRRGALVSVGPRLQTGLLGRGREMGIDSEESVVELLRMLQESDGNPQLKVVVDDGEGGSREMIVSADELLGFMGPEPEPETETAQQGSPEPEPETETVREPVRTASGKRKREAAADPRGSTTPDLEQNPRHALQHELENIRMTRRLAMLRAKATSRKLKRERRKAQRLGKAAASMSPLPPATTASDAVATSITATPARTDFAGFKKGFLC